MGILNSHQNEMPNFLLKSFKKVYTSSCNCNSQSLVTKAAVSLSRTRKLASRFSFNYPHSLAPQAPTGHLSCGSFKGSRSTGSKGKSRRGRAFSPSATIAPSPYLPFLSLLLRHGYMQKRYEGGIERDSVWRSLCQDVRRSDTTTTPTPEP